MREEWVDALSRVYEMGRLSGMSDTLTETATAFLGNDELFAWLKHKHDQVVEEYKRMEAKSGGNGIE